MKTPKLDELIASEYMEVNRGDFHIVSPLAKRLRAAVAEDMRAACEGAFEEGRNAESHWPNPYARKAGT